MSSSTDVGHRVHPNIILAVLSLAGLAYAVLSSSVIPAGASTTSSDRQSGRAAAIVLSSDTFDPRDRFDAWREELMLRVMRVDVSVPDRRSFRTRLRVLSLPNLGIIALLAVGGWRVSSGAVSPGDLVQAMSLFTLLAFPMRVIGFIEGMVMCG